MTASRDQPANPFAALTAAVPGTAVVIELIDIPSLIVVLPVLEPCQARNVNLLGDIGPTCWTARSTGTDSNPSAPHQRLPGGRLSAERLGALGEADGGVQADRLVHLRGSARLLAGGDRQSGP